MSSVQMMLLTTVIICCLSVFANGVLFAMAIKQNQEMFKMYQNMLNLLKHSKLTGRLGRRR